MQSRRGGGTPILFTPVTPTHHEPFPPPNLQSPPHSHDLPPNHHYLIPTPIPRHHPPHPRCLLLFSCVRVPTVEAVFVPLAMFVTQDASWSG